jgi:beta-carotene 3-hydroxylase
MSLAINIVLFIATFWFMEFMAWFTHKYVMHGFLWSLHKDHHKKEHYGFFEKNDFFFLIFAIPSWLCIMLGLMYQVYSAVWIGAGIAAYGLVYFLIHEVFIHQRFKWIRNIDNNYFRAIRRAHKIHHKHLNRWPGECFGMLIVPKKYFEEAKKSSI